MQQLFTMLRCVFLGAMDWARRHLILFGTIKFLSGLLIGGVLGFGLGVYYLPVLTAEKGLDEAALTALSTTAQRSGTFTRELADSDAFHWGEGEVYVNAERIWLQGQLAPGPDYRLYLTPRFVETEVEFLQLKVASVQVAPIKAFRNFAVAVPPGIDVSQYAAVLIWCEAFGQFITAAALR